MDRKESLYALIVSHGGRLPDDVDIWRALGGAAGYSGRSDLAGFFGGREPSMVRSGGQRILTPACWQRASRATSRDRRS